MTTRREILLGGTVGLGTVAYALAIGPIMHVTVPLLVLRPGGTRGAVAGEAGLEAA